MIIAQSAATSGAFALRYHDSVDEDADILRLGCYTLGYMPVRDGRAADALEFSTDFRTNFSYVDQSRCRPQMSQRGSARQLVCFASPPRVRARVLVDTR